MKHTGLWTASWSRIVSLHDCEAQHTLHTVEKQIRLFRIASPHSCKVQNALHTVKKHGCEEQHTLHPVKKHCSELFNLTEMWGTAYTAYCGETNQMVQDCLTSRLWGRTYTACCGETNQIIQHHMKQWTSSLRYLAFSKHVKECRPFFNRLVS